MAARHLERLRRTGDDVGGTIAATDAAAHPGSRRVREHGQSTPECGQHLDSAESRLLRAQRARAMHRAQVAEAAASPQATFATCYKVSMPQVPAPKANASRREFVPWVPCVLDSARMATYCFVEGAAAG